MKNYTLYQISVSEPVLPINRKHPHKDGETFPHDLPDDYVYLEESVADDPAFDPATHRVKLTQNWVYDVPNLQAIRQKELVALPVPSDTELARTQMAADWRLLDFELRGLFHSQYMAANNLLDEGDYEAAKALVDGIDPFEVIKGNPTKLATFNGVKAQFSAAITALPTPPTPPIDPI